MSEFMRRFRERVDERIAYLESAVSSDEAWLAFTRRRARERLVAGYDPERCMAEVRGRQCTRSARPTEELGFVLGFCPQHDDTTAVKLRKHRGALADARREAEVLTEQVEERQEVRRRSGVYVIGAPGGPVKIGVTSNLGRRLTQLRVSSPHHIDVLAWIPQENPYDLEAELHDRFGSDRLSGEWFGVSDGLRKWLAEVGE